MSPPHRQMGRGTAKRWRGCLRLRRPLRLVGYAAEPPPHSLRERGGDNHGHLTIGGIELRIESTFPPVFRPNMVPRS